MNIEGVAEIQRYVQSESRVIIDVRQKQQHKHNHERHKRNEAPQQKRFSCLHQPTLTIV